MLLRVIVSVPELSSATRFPEKLRVCGVPTVMLNLSLIIASVIAMGSLKPKSPALMLGKFHDLSIPTIAVKEAGKAVAKVGGSGATTLIVVVYSVCQIYPISLRVIVMDSVPSSINEVREVAPSYESVIP